MTTRQRIETLTSDLVQIDARNAWLIPGGPGEGAIADWIAARVEGLGVPVELEAYAPGHPNVIARLGTGSPVLCFNAHMDTVGAADWPDRAFHAVPDGNRLVGLGTGDDKGHCAALLAALEVLARQTPAPGTLLFAWVADEEGESRGTSHLIEQHPMDACLIAEPFGLSRALVTHQGFGWLDLTVTGRAAHGSAPDVGIDAISHMSELVRRLDAHAATAFMPNPHPLNGVTVYHASTIRGGSDYATYPAQATLGIEIGTQPGETIDERVHEIEAIFEAIQREVPNFQARVDVRLHRPPFEAHGHERLWDALDDASRTVTGNSLQPAGQNAWGDAGLTSAAGIPTLYLGASGGNFHAADEWVDVDELAALSEILIRAAEGYLRGGGTIQ